MIKIIKEIQNYVKRHYGYTPKSCWIAHVKKKCGLPVRRAWNRQRRGGYRANPCPKSKEEHIKEALKCA